MRWRTAAPPRQYTGAAYEIVEHEVVLVAELFRRYADGATIAELTRWKLDAYATSQDGWNIVAKFSDDASGASLDRPGLQRAIAAAWRRRPSTRSLTYTPCVTPRTPPESADSFPA